MRVEIEKNCNYKWVSKIITADIQRELEDLEDPVINTIRNEI